VYRIPDSGEAKYPAALQDTKAAVRWVRANAEKYHIVPDRIGAAVGNLAGMLGTAIGDPAYEGNIGDNLGVSSRILAVAAFNPALDLVGLKEIHPSKELATEYLGCSCTENPEKWKTASPRYHVSAKSAAFLLLHRDADAMVPYSQSSEMSEKLRASGVWRAQSTPFSIHPRGSSQR